MKNINKKSILSLLAKETGKKAGGYLTDKLKDATGDIQKRIDPRTLARTLGGKGFLGDAAVGVTDLLMKGVGFGAKKFFGKLGFGKKKDPQFSTIGSGPIRVLKVGDSIADILGKMYNFMLKNDEVQKLNDEIEKAFRQEQLDEDGRRHDELVKAIKGYTKKYKRDDTTKPEEEKGFLDTILDGLKLWSVELLADLAAFAAEVAALLGLGIVPPKLPKGGRKGQPKGGPKETSTDIGESITKPTPKGVETPAQRRNPPKTRGGTNRETRISRNTPPPPAVSTAEKVAKFGKGALKLTNTALLKGLNGVLDLLNKIPGLKYLAIGIDLIGEVEQLINDAMDPNRTATNDELIFRLEKIGAKFLGGIEGVELGGLIGASVGTTVGGPWGTLLGLGAGSYIGAELGEELFGALFERYATGKWPEINYPKATEYAKEHGFVIGEGGAAFGTNVKVLKKRTPAPVPKQDISNRTVPTNQLGLGPNESVVSVNNTMNNIGGKSPKVLSTNTAKQRNSDLDKYLRTTVVPV